MKSQRAITLTSLVIYITVVLIVVGILAVISGSLQGNIKEIYAEGTNNVEIDKFNVYFLKEVKKQGNAIDPIPESVNEIIFKTGNKYTFNSTNECIYLNDNIKIAENIENCEFLSRIENEKTIITVTIKAVNGEEKTIEYVLNDKEYSISYEDENDYIYNAIDDSETSILPEEYQELEYIESTGTQYINTDYTPDSNTSIELKVAGLESKNITLYCARTNQNLKTYTAFLINGRDLRVDYNSTKYSNIKTVDSNVVYVYKQDKNLIYVDNELIKTIGETAEFKAECDMILLASHEGGNNISNKGKAKLYYCKIWDNGTLVRNLIPCKRTLDGTIGMYDKVNNVFYTNSGEGNFETGPEV